MIRLATPKDSSAIIFLWKRLMTEEDEAVDFADVSSTVNRWSWRLKRQIEEQKALVAEEDSSLTGFTCFIGRPAEEDDQTQQHSDIKNGELPIALGTAYITDLYVVPEARRTGIAQALLKALIRSSESSGFQTVLTNTNCRNLKAQALLKKTGFVPAEDFEIPGLENQIYYAKTLR